ncbi:hypothetical protein [Thiohalorhabdus methylotrophus]|uniref:Uncharacterized protein n=1 Tax=Thiohalorhabdus methylotrophus TaxID=3242694 RepID=A0ABV4TZP9_9GAMM
MFGSKRKRYNADVRELLPRFGFDIDDAGMMKTLDSLDIAWKHGYNKYEASLFIAWLVFAGMLQGGETRFLEIYKNIKDIQNDWVAKGAVRSDLSGQFERKIKDKLGSLMEGEGLE